MLVAVKDSMFRAVTGLHKTLFTATNGRVLGRLAGMPVLVLITTGRKSGHRRSTMLTAPVQKGDSIVLVASFGGDDRHPTWFLNLRDNPEVEAVMDGRRRPMLARVATDEEKSALWPEITESYRGYAGYQKKTDRDIPVVILDPR